MTAPKNSAARPALSNIPTDDSRPFLFMDLDGTLLPYTNLDEDGIWTGYSAAKIIYEMQINDAARMAAPQLAHVFQWIWCTTWPDESLSAVEDYFSLPPLPTLSANPLSERGRTYKDKLANGRAFLERHPGRRVAWCDDRNLGQGIRAFQREMGESLLWIKPRTYWMRKLTSTGELIQISARLEATYGGYSGENAGRTWTVNKGLTEHDVQRLLAFAMSGDHG